MTHAQGKAIREAGYRFAKALTETRHAFERFNEAWLRSQNEDRRRRELNRLRNRTSR